MTTNVLIPRPFFARDSRAVARELLGHRLVHILPDGRRVGGRVVEAEAYRPGDRANHAYRGKTERNAPMFEPPGTAYVYFAYGAHHLFNVVTEGEGVGAAVLVRALQPVEGIDFMRARHPKLKDRDLCRGPGRLCQALAIDLSLTGYDMFQPGSVLFFEQDTPVSDEQVRTSPRVGVSGDETALTIEWRWFVAGSPFVSGRRRTTDHRDVTVRLIDKA